MNRRQLVKLGIPESCAKVAVDAIRQTLEAESDKKLRNREIKQELMRVLESPNEFLGDRILGKLAAAILEDRELPSVSECPYETWGAEHIDDGTHSQMKQACSVPVAVKGALMPDAHVGYGLPIGGVLACENAVIPYAVGVDIACRMKLSILDMPLDTLESRFESYKIALEKGTCFGVGANFDRPENHDVMDQDWSITRITREKKDRAWIQLGSSGSGNHFVEFGKLTLEQHDSELNLDAGQYVALLSHSGSRGAGAAVCSTYSAIARNQMPSKYKSLGRLAWLELSSQAGQEYWEAMNLMGDYASANHDVIHRRVTRLLGAKILGGVENHHNFAWKEEHDGREVIVHRKGATPAGLGVLGVIPGSMATPAFVVRGTGNGESLSSASHGAGRQMSRTAAKNKYRWNAVRKSLSDQGVSVLSAGADEVPGAYKNIHDVMQAQKDLVDIVAQFDPLIVKMCGDGSKAED